MKELYGPWRVFLVSYCKSYTKKSISNTRRITNLYNISFRKYGCDFVFETMQNVNLNNTLIVYI